VQVYISLHEEFLLGDILDQLELDDLKRKSLVVVAQPTATHITNISALKKSVVQDPTTIHLSNFTSLPIPPKILFKLDDIEREIQSADLKVPFEEAKQTILHAFETQNSSQEYCLSGFDYVYTQEDLELQEIQQIEDLWRYARFKNVILVQRRMKIGLIEPQGPKDIFIRICRSLGEMRRVIADTLSCPLDHIQLGKTCTSPVDGTQQQYLIPTVFDSALVSMVGPNHLICFPSISLSPPVPQNFIFQPELKYIEFFYQIGTARFVCWAEGPLLQDAETMLKKIFGSVKQIYLLSQGKPKKYIHPRFYPTTKIEADKNVLELIL